METRVYHSPVGTLKLQATAEGVCAVKWLEERQASPPRKLQEHAEEEREEVGDPARRHINACVQWLDDYFDGTLLAKKTPRPRLALPMKG